MRAGFRRAMLRAQVPNAARERSNFGGGGGRSGEQFSRPRLMLYGRDRERALIGALLAAARDSRSGALVLRGDPGVGKSALLLDARERATDMHVLTARGVESESEMAERRPVLCLVDDANWLDSASADALRFVARRLDAEGILMLFAARDGEIRSFDAEDLPTLRLDGLDLEAAGTLLSRGAGVDAPTSVRERLVEQTGGNALALVELPSALTPAQLAGDEPLPDALPMTRQVENIFLERVRRLPAETQRLLLIAAADDSESAALVARAGAGIGVGVRAMDAAEEAGLIVIQGTRLEFRHPLVRSAVYDAATSSERRAAHHSLAEALAEDTEHVDRRAWHLAASVLDHDESVAEALEAAAERARDRAGYMAAARALERAADLSVDGASRGRRLASAARAASAAGNDQQATWLAEQARAFANDPRMR